VWWSTTSGTNGICDDCNSDLKKGDGYRLVGNHMCCERCTDSLLESADWEMALQNIDSYVDPGIPQQIQKMTGV
jgi:hypothetical protein